MQEQNKNALLMEQIEVLEDKLKNLGECSVASRGINILCRIKASKDLLWHAAWIQAAIQALEMNPLL